MNNYTDAQIAELNDQNAATYSPLECISVQFCAQYSEEADWDSVEMSVPDALVWANKENLYELGSDEHYLRFFDVATGESVFSILDEDAIVGFSFENPYINDDVYGTPYEIERERAGDSLDDLPF